MNALTQIGQALRQWLSGVPPTAARAPCHVPAGRAGHHLHYAAEHGAWAVGWCTRAGKRHLTKGMPCEDSVGVRFTPQGGIHAAVADGVSGGARGDTASAAAVGYVIGIDPDIAASLASLSEGGAMLAAHDNLRARLAESDDVVRSALATHAPSRSGATTLSAAWLNDQGLGWLNRVGDCRVYHWRPEPGRRNAVVHVEQSAPDQTFDQLGEVPPPGVPPDNPARMIGNGRIGLPELRPVQLRPGEGLLLCSDGLHDALDMGAIRACLSRSVQNAEGPLRFSQRLLRAARVRGSLDDIAVLVLRYQGDQKINANA